MSLDPTHTRRAGKQLIKLKFEPRSTITQIAKPTLASLHEALLDMSAMGLIGTFWPHDAWLALG